MTDEVEFEVVEEEPIEEPQMLRFTLLPPIDPRDPNEQMRYSCSQCTLEILHLAWHAQYDHGTKEFSVINSPKLREGGVPGSPCGVNGCTLDGNHVGPHGWEPR